MTAYARCESETEEAVFRVEGDTIYYPDPTDQPAAFRIIADSLVLSQQRYPIIRQDEHLFWFQNQSGDIIKLVKSGRYSEEIIAQRSNSPSVSEGDFGNRKWISLNKKSRADLYGQLFSFDKINASEKKRRIL